MRRIAPILIFALSAIIADINAATITWTGSSSTVWATAANWNAGVPTIADIVIIPGSLARYPILTTTASALSLTIATGANVRISTGAALTVAGDINISGTLRVDAGSVTTTSGKNINILSGGTFDLNAGTVTVGNDFQTETSSTSDISGGTLNVALSWRRNVDILKARGTHTFSGGAINIAKNMYFNQSSVTGTMSGNFVLTVGNIFKNTSDDWATSGGTVILTASWDGNGGATTPDAAVDIEVWNLIVNTPDPANVIDFSNSNGTGIIVRNNFTFTSGTILTHNGTDHSDRLQVAGAFSMGATATFKDAYLNADTYSAGSFSFNAASTYSFVSTSAQTLGTNRATSYGKLTINNPAGVTLGKAITVNGVMTMTSGKLTTTSTNLLRLSSTSTVSGGSATSFVNGPMSHAWPASGLKAKTFPLGKGATYRPLSMTLSTSASQVMRAELFNANAGGSKGSIGAISTVRYYQTSVTTGTIGSVAKAQITYGSDDNVSEPSELLVGRSTTKTGTYVSLGQSAYTSSTVSSATYNPTEAGDFLLLGTTGIFAVTHTWSGAINTDWATAGNWTPGVPSSINHVVIPGSLSNYPDINEAAACLKFTIATGGSATLSSGGTLSTNDLVSLSGTLQVDAGTVTTGSGKTMTVNSGGLLDLNGGTLSAGGALAIASGGKVTVGGTAALTTADSISVSDSLRIDAGTVTTSSGVNILVNNGGFIDLNGGTLDDGGVLTIASGGTVNTSGTSVLTTDEHINITGTLKVDAGTLTTATDMNISVNSGGLFDLNGGAVTAGGNFRTVAGSTTDISGGALDIGISWRQISNQQAKGTITLSNGTIDVVNNCFFSGSDVTGTMSGSFVLTVGDDFKNSANNWTVTGGTVILDASKDGAPNVVTSDNAFDVEVWNLTINAATPSYEFTFASSDLRGIIIGNNFTLSSGTVLTSDGTYHADHFQVDGTFSMGADGHFKDAILDADTYTVNAFSFNASSTYEYYRTTAQTISASRPASFGNLILNNSAGVTLGKAITVNGDLAMTNGLITSTSTNLLTLGSTASVSGGSATSFVNGPMANTWPASGVINKTFPLGKGSTYRPLDLSLSTSGSQVMKAELFNADAGGSKGSISAISTVRYYQTSVTSGNIGSVATVKLTFGSDDNVADPADLLVGRSTTKTGTYVTLGQSANTEFTVTSATFDPTEAGDFLLLGTTDVFAVTYTWDGSTDTDWATAANWDLGVPSSADHVLIPGSLGNYPNINEAAACIKFTISTGASATLSSGGTLSSSGLVSISGTLQVDAGTVTTIAGKTITVTSGGLLDLNGGTLAAGGALTVASGGKATVSVTATLTVGDDLTLADSLRLDAGSITTASGFDIIVNSGGVLDLLGGSADIGGALTINSGAKVRTNGSSVMTPAENIDVTGTLQVDSGTITMASGKDLTINSGGSFDLNGGAVTVGNNFATLLGSTTDISGGTLDIGSSWKSDGNQAQGTITLSGGTINVANNALFDDSNLTGTMSGSFVLTVGDNFRNSAGNWTITAGTVVLDASWDGAALLYSSNSSYDAAVWNLTINTANPANLIDFSNSDGRGINVANNFTFTSGTVIIDDGVNHSDHFQVDGTFSMGADAHFKDAYLDADTYTVNAFSFNASSIYEYTASATQTLGSERPASYGNLIFDNHYDLSLGQAITVNGTLTMTDGLLTTTNTNLLTMASTSSVSGGSDSSFVNGPMSNTWPASGTVNRTFPLGKGATYRPLDISLSTAGSQVMKAELFNGDAGGSTLVLNAISQVRYYETSVTSGTIGSVASVKITFGAHDSVQTPSTLVVAQSITKTGEYGTLGQSAYTASSVTSNAYDPTEAGDFLLLGSTGDNSLPVELSLFTAQQRKNSIWLKWITESEVENLGFMLERKESGSDNWKEIGSYLADDALVGQGSTTLRTEYTFEDKEIVNKKIYDYRLADVSYEGDKVYHSLTVDEFAVADLLPETFELNQNYPNPFNPTTTIAYGLPEDAQVSLIIYDITGREIKTLVDTYQDAGRYKLQWSGTDDSGQLLSAGIYFLRIYSKNFIEVKRMILVK